MSAPGTRGARFARAFGRVTAALAPFTRWRTMRKLQALFTRSHVRAYKLLGGRGFVGRLGGAPLLLLTTTGRRSGKRRTAPVIYVPGPQPALVASNGGARANPLWFRNLQAHPEAEIVIGRETRRVVAETLAGEERERYWHRAVEIYPSYADYQRRTDRELPVIVLRPVSAD